MTPLGTFPFGQPVRVLAQEDRTPKQVFVLGVYASAVHARWVSATGRDVVKALAVASEPYIFWRGEDAEVIIRNIAIPDELGKLLSADRRFNGPSGLALDELILRPLGLNRSDTWLCDLVPHSCANTQQQEALKRAYFPFAETHQLPLPTVPPVPAILADETRRAAILNELEESAADVLILLGDEPIKWFLSHFDHRWRRLADFGQDPRSYGRLHSSRIGHRQIDILPIAHPRQIAQLGRASHAWFNLHQAWLKERASELIK
jgi:hypothetical protein